MVNSGSEGILEVFDFENKYVFTSYMDEELLQGMINRGAKVWVNNLKDLNLTTMDSHLDLKGKLNDTSDPHDFYDYSIMREEEIKLQKGPNPTPIKQRIILICGTWRLFKWNIVGKRNYRKLKILSYSIAPSFGNVKMVIPEMFDVSLERYWPLFSKNPIVCIRLITIWVIIKNNFLRKLFIDKIILIT